MPIDPITGALVGQAAAGALGGLLSRRKKVKTPDYSGLINQLNQSGQRQRELISGIRPQTTALGNQFKTDTANLANQFTTNIGKQAGQFVSDFGDESGRLTEQSAQAGRRRILENQPELTQNLRESLAASGLNRGGALLAAQGRQNQELGRQIGELNTGLELGNIEAKRSALRDAFQTNTQAAQTATGLNANALNTLLASGREDLINEALNLAQEELGRTNAIVGLQGQGMQMNFASDLARRQQSNDLMNQLLGSAGGIAGSLLGRGGPAPAARPIASSTIGSGPNINDQELMRQLIMQGFPMRS